MKKITIFLVAVLLVLSACGSSKENSARPDATEPFIGGNDALKFGFAQGTPPDFVFDNNQNPFAIVNQIENLGEADVPANNLVIKVVGVNPMDFGIDTEADRAAYRYPGLDPNALDIVDANRQFITGARKNFDGTQLPGDKDYVEFPDLVYLPDLNGNTGVIIRAEACYNYMTKTSTLLCIKKDLLADSNSEIRVCKLSEEKDAKNSGGPVQVTALKQVPQGRNKIQVTFMVEHVGHKSARLYEIEPAYAEGYEHSVSTGIDFKGVPINAPIIQQNTGLPPESSCLDDVTNRRMNRVLIDVTSLHSGQPVICSGFDATGVGGEAIPAPLGGVRQVGKSRGYVTLWKDAQGGTLQPRAITCTIDTTNIGPDEVYEELLTMDLYYTYQQSIEKPMEIRDVKT